jgi:hypothetical protein
MKRLPARANIIALLLETFMAILHSLNNNDAYRWLTVLFILGRVRTDEVDWSNRREGRRGGTEIAPREWNDPFLRVTAGSVAGVRSNVRWLSYFFKTL